MEKIPEVFELDTNVHSNVLNNIHTKSLLVESENRVRAIKGSFFHFFSYITKTMESI